MSKAIAFHLQKGGVGKTTVSGTLACQSALAGHGTLLIDCDPQGNLSSWFLNDSPSLELADVLQGKCFSKEAILKVKGMEHLYILPTFGIGGTLKNYSETKLSDEPFVIQDLVKELSESYERIVLDLSPGLGRLERAALIASDEIITPTTPEVFSLDGLEIFIEELAKLKKNYKSPVKHKRIIINSFDERIKQHRDIYSVAESSGRFTIFKIPVDPIFRKSQEANSVPQIYKVRGRGMKVATLDALKELDKEIWS